MLSGDLALLVESVTLIKTEAAGGNTTNFISLLITLWVVQLDLNSFKSYSKVKICNILNIYKNILDLNYYKNI